MANKYRGVYFPGCVPERCKNEKRTVEERLAELEKQVKEFRGDQYPYIGTASLAPGGTQGHFYKNFGSVLTWLRFLADRIAKLEKGAEEQKQNGI